MPAVCEVKVFGIKEALKEINEIDRTLRRQITKDIQARAGSVLVNAARSLIPTAPPLSGMARGNMIKGRDGTGWSSNRVRAGIKTVVAKTNRQTKSFDLLVLQQKDAAGAIWDHAGRKTDGAYVTNLVAYGGHVGPANEPRALQPAAEASKVAVEKELLDICQEVMSIVNRKLVTKG